MSFMPQGRGISFPIVWGNNPLRSANAPKLPGALPPDDAALMARLKANDSSALEVLFSRYSRLVLGIALRILHDHGEAEEVVQETFFQVFQKSKLFDASKGAAKAWIIQIACRRALDRKSYLNRRGFYRGTDVGSLDDTLSGATDLDREVGARLDRVQLEKAFEELPEVQRRTLELFYFEGLELREIAAKLGDPLGNVRHHFYRGLERLRKSAFIKELREN